MPAKKRARIAVVDGTNIAYEEPSRGGKPKVGNLIAVKKALEQRGYEPIIIVDASFRHEADDPEQLEALIDSLQVRQAPAGTQADYFVLETAEHKNAIVVSNDQYKQYREQYPWIDERRVPLMIID